MLYYECDFYRCRTSARKIMLEKMNENSDCIIWYDDGENIFFGDCTCNYKQIIEWIKRELYTFNPECWTAGDL